MGPALPELAMKARFCSTIGEPWTGLRPLQLGPIPGHLPTADGFVVVERGGNPWLRLDIYFDADDYQFCREAILWGRFLALGFGHRVVLVDLDQPERMKEHDLGDYFCSFYSHSVFLLAASGSRVFRLAPDGNLLWNSPEVGVDGVILNNVEDGTISGVGEWDPPGGWMPFRLRLRSGDIVRD